MSSTNFSSSAQHVLFVLHRLVVRWEVSGRTTADLWDVASRICSEHHVGLLRNPYFVFFSIRFVSFHAVHPHSSTDTNLVGKKSCFILSERSHFHMIDTLSIAFHAFDRYMLTSLSVDEIFLPRYLNLSTNFISLTLRWFGLVSLF